MDSTWRLSDHFSLVNDMKKYLLNKVERNKISSFCLHSRDFSLKLSYHILEVYFALASLHYYLHVLLDLQVELVNEFLLLPALGLQQSGISFLEQIDLVVSFLVFRLQLLEVHFQVVCLASRIVKLLRDLFNLFL